MESFLYRDLSTFLEKTIIQSVPKIWLHTYIEMIPHFLRQDSTFLKKTIIQSGLKMGKPLDRNASTFLEKAIIQSLPKIWLHLYIEMIPYFLMQCFISKCVLFRQCKLYGINSISVIDAPPLVL